jgi:uncharacterized membrane protein YgdD (TMEM256/DUF423 family)
MQKLILMTGSTLGALSVMIGAFGAHALKPMLEANQRLETFETAVKYQFYHTLAIVLIGVLLDKYPIKLLEYSAIAMLIGIVIFSGSLYILSITGITKWGMVTPIGGLFMVIGWLLLLFGIWKYSA